jgi:hypothetical protein
MTVMPNGVNLTLEINGVSRTDAASAENGPQLDALYTQWKRDPASVDAQWHAFFAGFELGCQQPPRRGGEAVTDRAPAAEPASDRNRQSRVDALVSAYRRLGHQQARIDPLNLIKRRTPELSFDYMKLTEEDLDSEFEIYWAGKPVKMPLHTMIDLLHETYCGHVGIEYMHIENYTIRRWLRDRIEEGRLRKDTLSNAEKKRVLSHLLEGELFEKFLLAGRRRDDHSDPRQNRRGMSPTGRRADRDGHGASWTPQRPGEHPGQGLRIRLQRVRGQLCSQLRVGRRRREVPPRLRFDRHHQLRK